MSKQKTIIHFSQDFTKGKPQLGGYSRIYNLCSDTNNHIIYTISTKIDEIEEYAIDAIRVVQIPVQTRPSGVLNQFKLYKPIAQDICKHIEEHNIIPDLFFGHSHQGNFLILQYVRNTLFAPCKILWEANGIGGCPKIKAPFKAYLANRVQYQLQKYVFKKADTIVAQTQQSKQFIAQEFNIKEGKIEVVPNAIVVTENESLTRVQGDKPKVLCFGLFDELNGIPFLINAIKKHSFNDIEFVFAGFGKYTEDVKNLASSAKNVTYLGQLPYKDMMRVLPTHEFLIIPRLNTLGAKLYIPTKLLEGMYLGVVPICSDVEGMTCVVSDAENGLVFEKGNTFELSSILKSISTIENSKYQNLQRKAYKSVVETYNWKANFIKLSLIYDRNCNDTV